LLAVLLGTPVRRVARAKSGCEAWAVPNRRVLPLYTVRAGVHDLFGRFDET